MGRRDKGTACCQLTELPLGPPISKNLKLSFTLLGYAKLKHRSHLGQKILSKAGLPSRAEVLAQHEGRGSLGGQERAAVGRTTEENTGLDSTHPHIPGTEDPELTLYPGKNQRLRVPCPHPVAPKQKVSSAASRPPLVFSPLPARSSAKLSCSKSQHGLASTDTSAFSLKHHR